MDWRPISPTERGLINLLLSAQFDGRDVIQKQIESAMVRTIHAEGSFEFNSSCTESAEVRRSIPVEAKVEDSDGVTIHMLLHILQGKVNELEIYKNDLSQIMELPPPERWTVIVLE